VWQPDQVALSDAAQQAWPPFVLVGGLLLIGLSAHGDGLFERAGNLLRRLPGPPVALLAGGLVLVTAVTAVLNLDTSVVFLTPILVLAARARGLDEQPFLYASVYVANASSLYLPGSNLTNLLVLAHDPLSGGTFAARQLAPAVTATVVTSIGVWLLFRHRLREPAVRAVRPARLRSRDGLGVGLPAVAAAAALTLALTRPALPVLAVGVVAIAVQCARGRIEARSALRALGPGVLAALFAASVMLGVVARAWDGPAQLLAGCGRWQAAGLGALGSVALNNLPATVLLSAQTLPHPRALLIGLNLGPNLAVTGSLSAYLWLRAARQVDAQPSIAAFSRFGVVLAPLAIAAALVASSMLRAPS
jgi:arsenical pump membrane protein